jgi:hypothetical protein
MVLPIKDRPMIMDHPTIRAARQMSKADRQMIKAAHRMTKALRMMGRRLSDRVS